MEFAESLAPMLNVPPEEALESAAACVGNAEEIVDQLHRRREEWGVSYVVVGGENIEEFAPVVAKLAGT
jgi:hypothetical protein